MSLFFHVISLPSFVAGIYRKQLVLMPMCAIIFSSVIWNSLTAHELWRFRGLHLLLDRYMGSPELWKQTKNPRVMTKKSIVTIACVTLFDKLLLMSYWLMGQRFRATFNPSLLVP